MVFLNHIIEFINDIENFTKDTLEESFLKDRKLQSALIRSIEIIGEAVKNIPLEFRKKYPNIEWIKITGMRDKLMHHYVKVYLDRTL